jgi:hypothetical protein
MKASGQWSGVRRAHRDPPDPNPEHTRIPRVANRSQGKTFPRQDVPRASIHKAERSKGKRSPRARIYLRCKPVATLYLLGPTGRLTREATSFCKLLP